MSEYRRIETPPPRRLGSRAVLLLVLLAFLVGLALAVFAVRRVSWLQPRAPASAQPVASSPAVAPASSAPAEAAALATREAVLAGQIATLEARVATIGSDVQSAGEQAGRAEALLVAFAARRAIDRGLALGYLEGQLRLRFGATEPRAVAELIRQARNPLTLGELREGLASIGPDIATGASAGWAEGLRRELGMLVMLRKEGTPSPLPQARLDRARVLLEGGQVEAARAEVARLPGAAQAGNWMEAAGRYVAARHALDRLEAAALRAAPVLPTLSTPVTPPAEDAPSMR